ncbi:hypothetical protein [Ruegeria lacuscaerulensis]|uniref:hypothetical protein n=1 Tax=Ruegeria lacuscaerulensis TaxID=55218 RepID=UPI00147DC4F4|nr:hypothetical protein [Ruegeria lacuscaerulensis]
MKSTGATKAFLTTKPGLSGIFSTNDCSAIGAAKGAQELGTEGMVMIGYETVKAAVAAMKGKGTAVLIDTSYYHDAPNMDDRKIPAVLHGLRLNHFGTDRPFQSKTKHLRNPTAMPGFSRFVILTFL